MKLAAVLIAIMAACAVFAQTNTSLSKEKSMGKSIVIYFSATGEQYNVGRISEGNTAVIAKMIAAETGAELFEIVPEKPYPTDSYTRLTEIAKDEQRKKARPALKSDIDISAYDTVFLGYPNWWGDMPMIVYSFIESHDWQGKTVRPFCTHEGSGLAGTESKLRSACKGATVAKGLAVQGKTAQTARTAAKKAVQGWL